MDFRWRRIAQVLVGYSTEVRAGERVMIAMTETEGFPLVAALYRECIRVGAFPQVQFLSEELNRELLKAGTRAQLEWVPEVEAFGMEWADVYFGVRGSWNPAVFWDIPAERLSLLRGAMGRISSMRWEKTRWCLLRLPGAPLAQQAGVDEETMSEAFFESCLLDWPTEAVTWRRWADELAKGKEIRILGRETDLRFSVAGRTWEAAAGKINMPDGEIATSPVDSSVDGEIAFETPAVFGGRLIEGLRLRFRQGVLEEASASSNEDFLHAVLATDEGARRVGEFAFGTNPKIHHLSNDILLDEKIAGTVHLALGRAYPATGGTNRSAIHWDLVKDLRAAGMVLLDGEPVLDRGKMLL